MTIKDIARTCNVSISTVSRVLNNHPDVSEAVRQKVLEVVESQGYIPNNSARDLVRSSSDAIGVVVRGVGNLFFSDLLKTISKEIENRGYTMVLHFINSDADEVKAGAILEREKKLRGLLFLGGRFDYTPTELALIGVPYVCCSYTNRFGSLKEEEYSSVSIDDYQAAYNAVNHLIQLGHRKIAAVIPSRTDRSIGEMRYQGYCDALHDAGIPVEESLIVETAVRYDMPTAYSVLNRMLTDGVKFTALFVPSDTMAMAAMKAIGDFGLRVPDDISVIAIDGLQVSEYITPTLTTMVQPAEEMGRKSVRILVDVLEGKGRTKHLRVEAKIREGASVKPL